MRKSRVVVKDVDPSLYEQFTVESVFPLLEKLEISVPSWAAMLFAFIRTEKQSLDVSFFEEAENFFMWYSRVLVGRPEDLKLVSLARNPGKDWLPFAPPTLIGVNIRTKLR